MCEDEGLDSSLFLAVSQGFREQDQQDSGSTLNQSKCAQRWRRELRVSGVRALGKLGGQFFCRGSCFILLSLAQPCLPVALTLLGEQS